MKRPELIEHIEKNGGELLREGGRHSVYLNPARRRTSTLPRHGEFTARLARKICRDLQIPEP